METSKIDKNKRPHRRTPLNDLRNRIGNKNTSELRREIWMRVGDALCDRMPQRHHGATFYLWLYLKYNRRAIGNVLGNALGKAVDAPMDFVAYIYHSFGGRNKDKY